MNRYSMIVQWSDEDQLFLVTIPEFADRVIMPCTHGKTRAAAIRHGEEVRNGFATTARRLCIRKILAAKCLNVRASTAIPIVNRPSRQFTKSAIDLNPSNLPIQQTLKNR